MDAFSPLFKRILPLLLVFLASFGLQAQVAPDPIVGCSDFEFVFCKTAPAAPWPANSTSATPGAFQCFYDVKLRTKNQTPLPASWDLNWLAFQGTLTVNGFTSRINADLTNAYSNLPIPGMIGPNPYFQYLSIADAEKGDITWIVNPDNPLCETNNPSTLFFPANATEVTLFTIVVDAVEGENLRWKGRSIDVSDCITYDCGPGSTIDFEDCSGGSSVNPFPKQPVCNPIRIFSYELGPDPMNKEIFVRLGGVNFQNPIDKLDGVLHLIPQSTGVNEFDFQFKRSIIPIGGNQFVYGPKLSHILRKNSDGSVDIYFWLPDDAPNWSPIGDPTDIFSVKIGGYVNSSLELAIDCSIPVSRLVEETSTTTCKIHDVPETLVMPGLPPCASNLSISGTTIIGSDCDPIVRFTINHNSPARLISLN